MANAAAWKSGDDRQQGRKGDWHCSPRPSSALLRQSMTHGELKMSEQPWTIKKWLALAFIGCGQADITTSFGEHGDCEAVLFLDATSGRGHYWPLTIHLHPTPLYRMQCTREPCVRRKVGFASTAGHVGCNVIMTANQIVTSRT